MSHVTRSWLECSLLCAVGVYNSLFFVVFLFRLDLFTYMENRDFAGLKELEAKKLFRQLVAAVLHSHQRHVAHLDIKMENVLISNPKNSSGNKRIKLIDYGLCDLQHPGKLTTRWVGSPDYAADELLLKKPYKATKVCAFSNPLRLLSAFFCCLFLLLSLLLLFTHTQFLFLFQFFLVYYRLTFGPSVSSST